LITVQAGPERILQTGLGFWASKTLLSAIEMGVFTELARGPEPFDALTGRLGLHPRSARDFLDALVALGFLQRTGETYANTPETALFLDLPKKKMLIGTAFDALPSGGAFIVYESIIDDDRSQSAFDLMMSLNMLIETPAGSDYTGADCCGWMPEAGFGDTRVEHLVGPDSMVVGIKP
jgi:hypothetical protein